MVYLSWNLPRLFLFWGLACASFWSSVWVLYFQQRGLDLQQIGTLDAVTLLLSALLQVPTGALADTYGRRRCLALAALLEGVGLIGVTLHALSGLFFLGFTIWNVAYAFYRGADTAILFDCLRAEGREGEFQRWQGRFSAFQTAIITLSGALGAALGGLDLHLCFYASGGCLLAAAAVGATLREPPRAPVRPR